MKINTVHTLSPKFGSAYVTMTKENLSDIISKNVDAYNRGDFRQMYEESKETAQEVIDNVNATLKNSNGKIKTVNDLISKTDLFVLAGGKGSRFSDLANTVAKLRKKGENFNKISLPFELGNGQTPLTMLDIPLAIGRFFADISGYEKIIAEHQAGSFGDVIMKYLNAGNEPKDVVVCCGDNVFDMKSEKMLDYIVRTINNPKKQIGVVGVAKTPKQVADKFGVLDVGIQDEKTATFPLKGFVEKPDIATVNKLKTKDGFCIANTGMFVIKNETMIKLLDAIKKNPNLIARNDKEKYDFACATKWARDLNGTSASDVMIVETWEDVGEQKAYHNWLKQMKKGYYLSNFTPLRRRAILNAVKNRIGEKYIQFSLNPNMTEEIKGLYVIA